jgi:hypothetical protein
MRLIKSILLIVALSLGANLFAAPQNSPTAAAKLISPRVLVLDLYRQHAKKRGPFFQTRSRALLTRYFTKDLADLIWKDRVTAKGEVGALDGDPLYNAQDMEIKNLKVHEPQLAEGVTRVLVSFSNFGKQQEIKFVVVSKAAGWKIANIEYQDGTTLLGILKGN